MGMSAAPALKSGDPDGLAAGPSAKEVHNIAIIAGKTDTGAPAAAERAGLLIRAEPLFQVPVEAECRIFDTNQLACKVRISLHARSFFLIIVVTNSDVPFWVHLLFC